MVVELGARGERSAGWKPFQDKPALQIGAEAAVGGRARWVARRCKFMRSPHEEGTIYRAPTCAGGRKRGVPWRAGPRPPAPRHFWRPRI